MELISAEYLINKCDYSFGALTISGKKTANNTNTEFIDKCQEFRNNGNIMTLFIDNIRLYERDLKKLIYTNMEREGVDKWQYHVELKNQLVIDNSDQNLLKLCSEISDINFIIFTGLEDTNIDDSIFEQIPSNVLAIYAASCSDCFGEKLIPFPFGLTFNTERINLIKEIIKREDSSPTKLAYLNYSIGSNPYRKKINEVFENKDGFTIEYPKSHHLPDFENYLNKIKDHKFVLCPDGNAINCDCYRVWETLYMRRIPILKRSKNFEKMFQNLPVLFVDDFLDLTQESLKKHEFLFDDMKKFDFTLLDMDIIYENIIKSYDHIKISNWIKNKATNNQSLVLEISNRIESFLLAYLCASTGLDTYLIFPRINKETLKFSIKKYVNFLNSNFKNVNFFEFDLSKIFIDYKSVINKIKCDHCSHPLFSSIYSIEQSEYAFKMTLLRHISSNTNGLLISSVNILEDLIDCQNSLYYNFPSDVMPLVDYTKTEILEMMKTLNLKEYISLENSEDVIIIDSDEFDYEYVEKIFNFSRIKEDMNNDDKKIFDFLQKLNKIKNNKNGNNIHLKK